MENNLNIQPANKVDLNTPPEKVPSLFNNKLLFIILGILLIGTVAAGIYFYTTNADKSDPVPYIQSDSSRVTGNANNINSTSIITPSSQITNSVILQQISKENYTFYYPSNYEKSSPINDNNVYFFTRMGSSYAEAGEGIGLDVYPSQNRKAKPTFELCNNAANNQVKNEGKVISVQAIDYVNSHGCEVIISMPIGESIKDETITHFKQLWYKTGNDYRIYAAHGVYFASMSIFETQHIDSSIAQFILK
ncbi:MAG: hypothetical protein NUV52_02965 [Candidatus Roizmanbacteria bacterium]|nr:hypothetical protein [Candidatus Roizmanbacteria bacterium]